MVQAMRASMHPPRRLKAHYREIYGDRVKGWSEGRVNTEQPILDALGTPKLHIDAEDIANDFEDHYNRTDNAKFYVGQRPGRYNDPYRHTLVAAELRRKFGPAASWLITTAHELDPADDSEAWRQIFDPKERDEQDYTNNRIGRSLGKGAKDYSDVQQRVRDAIVDAILKQKQHVETNPSDFALNNYRRNPDELWIKPPQQWPDQMGQWDRQEIGNLLTLDPDKMRRGDDLK